MIGYWTWTGVAVGSRRARFRAVRASRRGRSCLRAAEVAGRSARYCVVPEVRNRRALCPAWRFPSMPQAGPRSNRVRRARRRWFVRRRARARSGGHQRSAVRRDAGENSPGSFAGCDFALLQVWRPCAIPPCQAGRWFAQWAGIRRESRLWKCVWRCRATP